MERYEGMSGKYSIFVSTFFFILGLIAALGLRLVLILAHYDTLASKLSWYVAIIIYIIFYYYRLTIENKRRNLIVINKLREKLTEGELSWKDKQLLKRLIDSMLVSKLRLNFFILVILSIISLIIALILDLS